MLFFLPWPALVLFLTISALVVSVALPVFRAIVVLDIPPSILCISISFHSLRWYCLLLLLLRFSAVVFLLSVRFVTCIIAFC
jgi:hypothetical protein